MDIPNQASWIIQRILKATKYFSQAGYSVDDILTMPNSSIKQFYVKLRGQFQKVSWRRLVCNNSGLPRWIFILRLAALGRLNTRDRLVKWGVTTNQMCPLCENKPECLNHLFFVCEVSTEVWKQLLKWIGITKVPAQLSEELKWAAVHAKGRNPKR
uniref:Putative ovule protein n=1 Tax=Solanum chacoense TaxID=4108 RepID=A0A0V0HDQ0_SOLCH